MAAIFRAEPKSGTEQIGFVPAVVAPELGVPVPVPAELSGSGTIEVEFATGARMRITGIVDQATLAATVTALSDGRRR